MHFKLFFSRLQIERDHTFFPSICYLSFLIYLKKYLFSLNMISGRVICIYLRNVSRHLLLKKLHGVTW